MSKRIVSLWLSGCLCMMLIACQSNPAEQQASIVPEKPLNPAEQARFDAEQKAAAERRIKQDELNEQAIITAKAEDADTAITLFEVLIEQNPKYPYAFTNLALQLLKKGNVVGARAYFLKAIEQDNSDAIAYNHLALIQRREGLFQEAEKNYRKAIEADENYANAHYNLGILLDIYLQKLPEALEHYLKYQELLADTASEESKDLIEKWIVDIKRRIDAEEG